MVETGPLTLVQDKRSCVVGLARECSDYEDDKDKKNGFAFLSEKGLSMFQLWDTELLKWREIEYADAQVAGGMIGELSFINGLATKVEKSRKQMKEMKNRARKICGVKKTKAGDAAKKE